MNINNKLFMNCLCFLSCQLMYAQSVSVEQAEHMANTFCVDLVRFLKSQDGTLKSCILLRLIENKNRLGIYLNVD